MRQLSDRLAWAAVAGLTLVGAGIRAVFIQDSLYLDEFYSWFEIHGINSPAGIIRSVGASLELSPPLYHLLTLPFTYFSSSPTLLRGPSFVLGTALIPLSAVIARRVGGWTAGILAGTFVTLSPFLTYFATEARPYATAAFFSALFFLFALRVTDQSRTADWVGLALAGTASIYTHYTTVFLVVAVLLWLFLSNRSRREVSATAIAIAILFLPWLSHVGDNGNLFLYGSVHGRGLLWFLTSEARSLVGTTYVPLRALPGMVPVIVAAVVLIAAIATFGRKLSGAATDGADPRVGLLVAALAVPTGLVVYSTVANTNLLIARNFVSATPFALCLVATGLASFGHRRLAAQAAVALSVVLAIGAVLSTQQSMRRSPQEAATRLIERALPSNGIVLVGGMWCGLPQGEQVTAKNSLKYVIPTPSSNPGENGQSDCPNGASTEPSYFHGGSRGAVYLDRRYMIAPINPSNETSGPGQTSWDIALREHLPVAVLLRSTDDSGKSSLWFNDPPPALLPRFRRVCFADFSGLFPMVATIWQPNQSPQLAMPEQCKQGTGLPRQSARYWRDMAVLSFANGRQILPQDRPPQLTDLLAPFGLLACLGATLAFAWRRREVNESP